MTLKRVLEPELMLDKDQARQYDLADFEIPHSKYPKDFKLLFPNVEITGLILDIGCGPADVTLRFARLFPKANIIGIDGSEEMLSLASERVASDPDLLDRVSFEMVTIPLKQARYNSQLIIANGMLHHMHNPYNFWNTVKAQSKVGTYIFVTDLLRPSSEEELAKLLMETCSNDHPIHKSDYENSLRAAFTPHELREQLAMIGLQNNLTVIVPEPNRVIIYGQI